MNDDQPVYLKRLLFGIGCALVCVVLFNWAIARIASSNIRFNFDEEQLAAVPLLYPMDHLVAKDVEYSNLTIRELVAAICANNNLDLLEGSTLPDAAFSFKASGVNWVQVLEVALEPNGYSYLLYSDGLFIFPIDGAIWNELLLAAVSLKEAGYGELKAMTESSVDFQRGGRLFHDKRRGTLVILERPERLKKIAQLVIEYQDNE